MDFAYCVLHQWAWIGADMCKYMWPQPPLIYLHLYRCYKHCGQPLIPLLIVACTAVPVTLPVSWCSICSGKINVKELLGKSDSLINLDRICCCHCVCPHSHPKDSLTAEFFFELCVPINCHTIFFLVSNGISIRVRFKIFFFQFAIPFQA